MKVDIEYSVKKAFGDEEWLAKMAIAGLFYLASSFVSFITNIIGNFVSALTEHGNDLSLGISLFLLIIVSIACLLTYILNCLPSGFLMATIKNEFNGTTPFLPDWAENWKKFFYNGLKLSFAIGTYFFICFIPLIITVLLAAFLSAGKIFHDNDNFSKNGTYEGLIQVFGIGGIVMFLLTIGLTILLSALIPMITIHFAVTESFVEAFNLKVIIGTILAHFTDYLLISLVIVGVYCVLGIVILITACCTCGITLLIVPALMVPLYIICFNLYTQIYKRHLLPSQ